MRRAVSSRYAIGGPIVPPNTAAAASARAARSFSPQALPGGAHRRAGRSVRVSARHGGAGTRARGRARSHSRQRRLTGVVRSPLWANMEETDREALYRATAERLLVGHVGDVEEIAEAYLYLIRQSYGTGQVLVVDGGAVLV